MTRKEKYMKFLMSIVDCNPKKYSLLFEKLLEIPFVYFIGNDSNRAVDGLDLRFRFEEEFGKVRELSEDCSILEAFIALSERCENEIMSDEDHDYYISEWFWVILDNLGLTSYTNNFYDEKEIEEICYIFNYRKYRYDGKNGGAFPIHNPREDLRDVELWYQLNWWLVENYEI